jgi:hypothetical protein
LRSGGGGGCVASCQGGRPVADPRLALAGWVGPGEDRRKGRAASTELSLLSAEGFRVGVYTGLGDRPGRDLTDARGPGCFAGAEQGREPWPTLR